MTNILGFALQHLTIATVVCFGGLAVMVGGAAYMSSRRQLHDFSRALPASARIVKVGRSYDSGTYGGFDVDLTLEVMPPGAAPYQVKTTWSVEPLALSKLKEGETLAVRISPRDRHKIYSTVDWAWSLGQTPTRFGNKPVIGYWQK